MTVLQESESPVAAGQVAEQNTKDADSLGTAQNLSKYARKRFVNLKARAALAGVLLYESTDGRGNVVYIVSRRNPTRELPDLDAAEAWLGRASGARA